MWVAQVSLLRPRFTRPREDLSFPRFPRNRLLLSTLLADTLTQPLLRLFLLGLYQQSARIQEMVAHVAFRICPISLSDRLKNRLVECQSVFAIDKLRRGHHHVEHGAMDHLKKPAEQPIP